MIRIKRLLRTSLLIGSVCGLAVLSDGKAPSLAQAFPARLTKSHFQIPSTPLPPNKTRSGGSLGEAECNGNREALAEIVALVPTQNPVVTTSAYPTVLIYVPYSSEQVSHGEFSMNVGPDESNTFYETTFTLPETPGIVSVSLAVSPDHALDENTPYHWYFKLYCARNATQESDVDVNGWIIRVESTPQLEGEINESTPEVWYDSLAALASRLQASPQDADLRSRWHNLLAIIHAENLAEGPLVGPVQLLEN